MTIEVRKLSMRSYIRIIRKFIEADFKAWTFYPTSWFINVLGILVSIFAFFMFAQLMIAIGHSFGRDFFAFLILANLSGAWLGVSMDSGYGTIMRGYWSRQLEIILLSPMSIVFYIFASSAWGYIMATVNMIISLALALPFGFTVNLGGNFFIAAIAVILSNIAAFGYGLVAASNVFIFKAKAGGTGATPTTVLLGWIISFASGSWYPLQSMPNWVQWLSILLPHTFVYDAIRRVFLSRETLGPFLIHMYFPFEPLVTDLIILMIQCSILVPIGYYFLKVSIEKAQREGDLTRWV